MSKITDMPETSRKGALAWMAGHSVAANLIMVACIIGGLLSLRNIKQEVFPETAADYVNIFVDYGGASPEEIEDGIVLAVEEAVRGVEGAGEITSNAYEGSAWIGVEVLEGADTQRVADEVKNEVDRITTFPEDTEEPRVVIAQRRREVISVMLYGEADEASLQELAEQLRDTLTQSPDITQVDINGVRSLEISINVPQENLRRYDLSIGEIASRVKAASLDLPGGSLKTAGGEILIRLKEKRFFGKDFADLPIISSADGVQVRLGDIAEITDGYADEDRYMTYNGQPAVEVEVFRVGDQTPIKVSNEVHRVADDFRQYLPEKVHTAIYNDRSTYFRQRMELLLRNGALGLVLVLLLLGMFLEARLAFWVMMGIPISFIGSFLFLQGTDVSINMLSMFAYIIALGIVVDDAIVVGENIYHKRQIGMGHLRAAVEGVQEVAMPVTFSILTNIATFVPLYFMPGMMGRFMKMMPVVIVIVFLISLIESVFVLPAHLAHAKAGRRGRIGRWVHARQQEFSHWFVMTVRLRFGPFLKYVLAHRHVVIAAGVSVLMIMLSYAKSGRMGMQMFPSVEADNTRVDVVFPFGSPVEKTEAAIDQLLHAAREVIEKTGCQAIVEGIVSRIGNGGANNGNIRVLLADADQREAFGMSTLEFTRLWREKTGTILGAESVKFASDSGGPGGGATVMVELSHRKIEVLEAASGELADHLNTYSIISDVDDGFEPGKVQFDFTVTPEGKALGFTATDIARQVRNAFYGAEVTRQQRGRNELKVVVRLPEAQRRSEFDIDRLMLLTPQGGFAPLKEIASVKRGRAYTNIKRRNGRRVIRVTAEATPRSKAGEVLESLSARYMDELARKHPGLTYSYEGREAEMRDSFGSLKISFPLAMLAIYAMLAIPFRSYIQPLIVMISIPFGVVGAILGHIIMGYPLSMMSFFGIVALSGVVVNDSLVLIDFANRRRRDGLSAEDAIHEAAIQRFRPIMLTTLTTFGGLTPMIFETSRQARFLIPMAISLGFGILFATGITLVLVPSLYLVVDRLAGICRLVVFGLPEKEEVLV